MTTDICVSEKPPQDPPFVPHTSRLFERTLPLFAAFLMVGTAFLVAAMLSVHNRDPQELLTRPNSKRSHVVIMNWLEQGYFHSVGMVNHSPERMEIYDSSTGVFRVSGFVLEKVYSTIFGHYSYRLLALHNQIVSLIISALAGLLSYRLARRFALPPLLGFAAGASVVAVVFTFPDNLDLFWEMSAQAYALLFALTYLLIEERWVDQPSRPRIVMLAQAAAIFMMAIMEPIVALGFAASLMAVNTLVRRDGSWKGLALVVILPCAAAMLLYQLQVKMATARFPDAERTGSKILFRTGLDGDSTMYGDHLDIAKRRDVARINWPANREYLFRWKWVFILGVVSSLTLFAGFIRGQVHWTALEALVALTGSWVLYAAVFSQSIVIHPYLYDVLLFVPLSIALFALAPSLLESITRRTGTILLVVVFCAFWYSLFQMRLYALRWPLTPPAITSPPAKG